MRAIVAGAAVLVLTGSSGHAAEKPATFTKSAVSLKLADIMSMAPATRSCLPSTPGPPCRIVSSTPHAR